MAYFPKRGLRKNKRRAPLRTKKRTMKPRGVSMAVAKYVKKAIHRNIENKVINEKHELNFAAYFANTDLAVQTISPSVTALPILQGTGQAERIGNTIKTRKLLLKYVLYPLPYQATVTDQPQPQEVIIWIGYLKNNRLKKPDALDFVEFFQNGNSVSPPYSNLWDISLPVNTDLFHICKTIRHKLGHAIYTDYIGIKPMSYFSNNDFKLNVSRSVDCTAYLNKTLKYVDGNTDPDTGLYMWMTAVNSDGTISTFNVATVGMFYTLKYEYEDA